MTHTSAVFYAPTIRKRGGRFPLGCLPIQKHPSLRPRNLCLLQDDNPDNPDNLLWVAEQVEG